MRRSFPHSEKDRFFSQLPHWEDDRRMHALFCEYDGRDDEEWLLHAWREYIDIAFREFFENLSATPSEILALFVRNGRRPIGLKNILERLYHDREIFTKQDLIHNRLNLFPQSQAGGQQNVGWMKWMVESVSFPLRYMRGSGQTLSVLSDDLQIYSASKAKALCNKMMDWGLSDSQKKIFTIDQVKAFAKETLHIREDDLHIVLQILTNHSLIVSTEVDVNDQMLKCIKFLSQGDPEAISKKESALLSLELSTETINHKIQDLEGRSETMLLDIRRHLKQKKRTTAMYLLRRKKQIEKTVEHFEILRHKLEEQALNISSAATNQQVMDAFQKTVTVQQSLEVDIDEFENVRADMADLQSQSGQIGEILASEVDTDKDEELLAELNNLEEGSTMSIHSTPNLQSTSKVDLQAMDALDQLTVPSHSLHKDNDQMLTSPLMDSKKQSIKEEEDKEEEKQMAFA